MAIDCVAALSAQCTMDFFWSALPLLIGMVWLVTFLGFATMLVVDVVSIVVDIFAHARNTDTARLRSLLAVVARRVAFVLLPVLVLGAAVLLAVMHLVR